MAELRYTYFGPADSNTKNQLFSGQVGLRVPANHVFVAVRDKDNPGDCRFEDEVIEQWMQQRCPRRPREVGLFLWQGDDWWGNDWFYMIQDDQLAFEFRMRWC